MNTLTNGFLLTIGMGWALCEACVYAGDGVWLPLIGFLTAFFFIFGAIGCTNISDKAATAIGNTFAIAMGIFLIYCAIESRDLGAGVFALKLVVGIIVGIAAVMTIFPSGSKDDTHQHS